MEQRGCLETYEIRPLSYDAQLHTSKSPLPFFDLVLYHLPPESARGPAAFPRPGRRRPGAPQARRGVASDLLLAFASVRDIDRTLPAKICLDLLHAVRLGHMEGTAAVAVAAGDTVGGVFGQ